jgi:hypothetical protein
MDVTLLSIGDHVRPGAYDVHSRFRRAVNFTSGEGLVSLVSEEVGGGPLNVVIAGPGCERIIASVSQLRVEADAAFVDGRRFDLGNVHRYRSKLVVSGWSGERFFRNLELFRQLLVENSSPGSLAFLVDEGRQSNFATGVEKAFLQRMTRGAEEVFRGDLLGGVKLLKGCGWGLTPSGDDFLAGLLIGVGLLQKLYRQDFSSAMDSIHEAALGGNVLSNSLLGLARKGLLFERMKKLVAALLGGEAEEVAAAARGLFAVGASSGADLATGFLMAVREGNQPLARWSRAAVAQGA